MLILASCGFSDLEEHYSLFGPTVMITAIYVTDTPFIKVALLLLQPPSERADRLIWQLKP